MPRARKKDAIISTSGATESCVRTRRSRGTKRRSEEKDGKDVVTGGAGSSQEENPPNQGNPATLQTTVKVSRSTQPPPLSKEPEYSRMCSECSSLLKPAVVPAGHPTSLLQCPQCSTTPLCEKCLYPCPTGTCTNQSCQVVSLLLTCEEVTDSSSRVYRCPLFRACPNCHFVMMHQKGCKYVFCVQCHHSYCFICLRSTQACIKDINMYLSLTCSAPRAARQRFQT